MSCFFRAVKKMVSLKDLFQLETLIDNYVRANEIEDAAALELARDPAEWLVNDENLPWTTSKIAYYNYVKKIFQCAECDHKHLLQQMVQHWVEAHGGLIVFHCSQCDMQSNYLFMIKAHIIREHNGIINGTFLKKNGFWGQLVSYLKKLPDKCQVATS